MSTFYRLSIAVALLAIGIATSHADPRSEIRQWQIRKGLVPNTAASRSPSVRRPVMSRSYAFPAPSAAIVSTPGRTVYTPAYQGGGHEGHGATPTTAAATGTASSCGGATSDSGGCCH